MRAHRFDGGNPKPRFPEMHEAFMQQAIDAHFSSGDMRQAQDAYEKPAKSLRGANTMPPIHTVMDSI